MTPDPGDPLIPDALCLAVPTDEQLRALPDAEKVRWLFDDPVKSAALRLRLAREHDAEYRPKVLALLAAGWTFEFASESAAGDLMAWAWRRPPRRAGSRGMRFASTDQAYRAMTRGPA